MRLHLGIALIVSALLFGGATRPDVLAPILPRLVAVASLGILVAKRELRLRDWSRIEQSIWLVVLATPALQLIPLPYGVWTALPLRDYPREIFQLMRVEPWQPLSLSPERTINAWCALIPAFAMYTLARAADDELVRRWFNITLLIALLGATLGVLQMGGGSGSSLRFYAITNNDAAVGFFSNANHHGTLLALAVPLLPVWAQRFGAPNERPKPIVAFAVIAAASLLAGAAILTLSRAGVGLFIAASLITLAATAPKFGRIKRRSGLLAVGGLIALALIAFVSSNSLWRFLGGGESEGRLETLPHLLRMLGETFPFGTGMGAFDPVFRSFETVARLRFGYLNNAHNDYLQLLIEAGLAAVVGLAMFLPFAALILWSAWQDRQRMIRSRRPLALAGGTAIVVLLVHSLVDYPLRGAGLSAIFALSCATLARYWAYRPRRSVGWARVAAE